MLPIRPIACLREASLLFRFRLSRLFGMRSLAFDEAGRSVFRQRTDESRRRLGSQANVGCAGGGP